MNPVLDAIAREIANGVCQSIDQKTASMPDIRLGAKVRYPAQYILETVIQILETRV